MNLMTLVNNAETTERTKLLIIRNGRITHFNYDDRVVDIVVATDEPLEMDSKKG